MNTLRRIAQTKALLKQQRKPFSENKYNYHHDFNPEHISSKTPLNLLLVNFDGLRVVFYLFAALSFTISLPAYVLFRSNNYVSNPDYLLDMRIDNK